MKKIIFLAGFCLVNFLYGHSHSHVEVVVHSHPNEVIIHSQPTEIIAVAPAAPTVVTPIVVSSLPPAPIVEAAVPSPGENYTYIPGYWAWNGQWVWQKQTWVIKAYPGAVWDPPHYHWSQHHGSYIWKPGHWK